MLVLNVAVVQAVNSEVANYTKKRVLPLGQLTAEIYFNFAC